MEREVHLAVFDADNNIVNLNSIMGPWQDDDSIQIGDAPAVQRRYGWVLVNPPNYISFYNQTLTPTKYTGVLGLVQSRVRLNGRELPLAVCDATQACEEVMPELAEILEEANKPCDSE